MSAAMISTRRSESVAHGPSAVNRPLAGTGLGWPADPDRPSGQRGWPRQPVSGPANQRLRSSDGGLAIGGRWRPDGRIGTEGAPDGWFLEPAERGNPNSLIDARHADGAGWTTGNDVTALVHGAPYFSALSAAVAAQRRGDLLLFTDWRGDPDERLDETGGEVGAVLGRAAHRGVVVRGLIWRSHLDRLRFSARENRHLGEEIEASGGVCLLDMRVRPGGSHHQKFVVLRHRGRPELDVAFLGGIDLCHSRRDDRNHAGDPQRQPMARVYGPRPPWHDVQVAVRGPAVGDIEVSFRERWDDPHPLSRNPVRLLRDRLERTDRGDRRLPDQFPDPAPCGTAAVQVLRTYPRRRPGYPFAPAGERSVARGLSKAVGKAERLIYLEDQFLWSEEVAAVFAERLRARPDLHLIAVVPLHPDQDGTFSRPPNAVGRDAALGVLGRAAPGRVAVYGLESPTGVPVYVHAKVCVIDDTWASVGSDNFNRRSWTHDSEISCAVVDVEVGPGRRPFPLALRLELAAEHLDRMPGHDRDLLDAKATVEAFERSAAALEAWHSGGRRGRRPPGRLRPLPAAPSGDHHPLWVRAAYRWVYDPDARSAWQRRHGRY